MFEKLSNKKMASASEKFDTLIGRTTTIQGNLILLESVRIDGKVVGNIVADQSGKITVAIGPMGEVVGDISAHRVISMHQSELSFRKTPLFMATFHTDLSLLNMVPTYRAWYFKSMQLINLLQVLKRPSTTLKPSKTAVDCQVLAP